MRPLIRLIFTMIVNRLTERMDFEGAEQKRNRYRLLFMVDEFPSLKRMEVFADALSYMAGYGPRWRSCDWRLVQDASPRN